RICCDEVGNGDEVTEFTKLRGKNSTLIHSFSLFKKNPRSLQRTPESFIRTHNSNVVAHQVAKLLAIVRNEYLFLWYNSAFRIPIGNVVRHANVFQPSLYIEKATMRKDNG